MEWRHSRVAGSLASSLCYQYTPSEPPQALPGQRLFSCSKVGNVGKWPKGAWLSSASLTQSGLPCLCLPEPCSSGPSLDSKSAGLLEKAAAAVLSLLATRWGFDPISSAMTDFAMYHTVVRAGRLLASLLQRHSYRRVCCCCPSACPKSLDAMHAAAKVSHKTSNDLPLGMLGPIMPCQSCVMLQGSVWRR